MAPTGADDTTKHRFSSVTTPAKKLEYFHHNLTSAGEAGSSPTD